MTNYWDKLLRLYLNETTRQSSVLHEVHGVIAVVTGGVDGVRAAREGGLQNRLVNQNDLTCEALDW